MSDDDESSVVDENKKDPGDENDSEGSTTAYSRKNSVEEVNETVVHELGEEEVPEKSGGNPNLKTQISSLADEVIRGASVTFSRISRKRETSISPKLTKKAKLNLDIQVKKYVSLSADLEQMEQYVNFARCYQLKFKENLQALGVTDEDIKKISTENLSSVGLSSLNLVDENSVISGVQDDQEDIVMDQTVGVSEGSLFIPDVEDESDVKNFVSKSEVAKKLGEKVKTKKTDKNPEKVNPKQTQKDEPKQTDENIITKIDKRKLKTKSDLDVDKGEKSVTKEKSAFEVLKKTFQGVKVPKMQDNEKDKEVEIVTVKKEKVNVVTPTPQKLEYDSDCIILSDGSDIDIGSVPKKKKEYVVVDLKKVKKEKGIEVKTESQEVHFLNSEEISAREMIQKCLKKNSKGCIDCVMSCGADFKMAVNMFKHVDDEICTQSTEERTTLKCIIENCNYTCVTKGSMRAHELYHLQIRYYECQVPGCEKSFVHASSLSNHKHHAHKEIYGDFSKSKKSGESTKGKKAREKPKSKKPKNEKTKYKKKAKKKSGDATPPRPKFTSSSSSDE